MYFQTQDSDHFSRVEANLKSIQTWVSEDVQNSCAVRCVLDADKDPPSSPSSMATKEKNAAKQAQSQAPNRRLVVPVKLDYSSGLSLRNSQDSSRHWILFSATSTKAEVRDTSSRRIGCPNRCMYRKCVFASRAMETVRSSLIVPQHFGGPEYARPKDP